MCGLGVLGCIESPGCSTPGQEMHPVCGPPTHTQPLHPPQSRSDFIGGRVAMALSLPTQEECLSLAVLDMLRIAKEKRQSPDEVFSHIR